MVGHVGKRFPTLPKTNIAVALKELPSQKERIVSQAPPCNWCNYFLLKMGIFQPAMLVYFECRLLSNQAMSARGSGIAMGSNLTAFPRDARNSSFATATRWTNFRPNPKEPQNLTLFLCCIHIFVASWVPGLSYPESICFYPGLIHIKHWQLPNSNACWGNARIFHWLQVWKSSPILPSMILEVLFFAKESYESYIYILSKEVWMRNFRVTKF